MIKKRLNSNFENIIIDTFIYISFIILFIVTIYPFINIIAISLNEAMDTNRGGIYFWPREFTLYNYESILKREQIYFATLNSILRTITGTILSVYACMVLSYIIRRKDFLFRKQLSAFVVITMYFSGGLIPIYMLFKSLGLINNFLVYIIPPIINAFNVMIIRTYMEKLPDGLIESAQIDGAGDLKILHKIIFPLSLPVIATIALFVSVFQWNSWFDTYIFASGKKSLSTLQYELMKILQSAQLNMSSSSPDYSKSYSSELQIVTPRSLRASMTIIATIPVLLIYPFLQKYFVKGLTMGGIKG